MTLRVITALIPACLWGVYSFGARAAAVLLICTASAVLFEFLYLSLVNKKPTVPDPSSALTGMLIGMTSSAAAPLWVGVAGAFFAMVVVKGIFGGLGRNIVNPALAANVFTTLAWPDKTGIFQRYGVKIASVVPTLSAERLDAVSATTPLDALSEGRFPEDTSLFDLIVGNTAGCIGEISAVLLIAGGIYLLMTRVITWHIPVSFIASAAIITFVFPLSGIDGLNFMLCELFSGGLILAAFYMATDPVTSPVTSTGQIIFGAGCGAVTVLIRYFGAFSEGAAFAVLIMNLLAGYIDRAVTPKYRGRGV